MKNIGFLSQGAAAALLFLTGVSCGNDEVIDSGNQNEFRIEARIVQTPPQGRSPELDAGGAGKFVAGDRNSLFFYTDGKEVLKNFEYVHGNKYYWSDINLSETVKTCSLAACYPAVSTDLPAQLEWNVVDRQENPDLLLAVPAAVVPENSDPIGLVFKHVMHKIHVEVVAGDATVSASDNQQAVITCKDFLPGAEVDILEGQAVSAAGNPASIRKTGAVADFIIPAQNAGEMEIVIALKDKTAVFGISGMVVNGVPLQKLESGKTLSITIKARRNDFVINGQNIDAWGHQGDFSDEIII